MRARKVFAWITTAAVQVGLVLWAGAKLMADWIGRSTIADDAEHARGLSEKGAEWLFLTPWWVPGALAAVLTGCVIFLILSSEGKRTTTRRSEAGAERPPDGVPTSPIGHNEPYVTANQNDKAAHNELSPGYQELLAFFIEYLEPVATALLSLQQEILSAGIDNEKVCSLAKQSLPTAPFFSSLSSVAGGLSCSPAQKPSFDELIVSIHNAEFSFQQCIDDTIALANSLELDISIDDRLCHLWNDLRIKHNNLTIAYKIIKRDPRFGRLFRPLRESRWGDTIQGVSPS